MRSENGGSGLSAVTALSTVSWGYEEGLSILRGTPEFVVEVREEQRDTHVRRISCAFESEGESDLAFI